MAGLKRVPTFETIPTLDEQGLKGFEAYAWQGMEAIPGTPQETRDYAKAEREKWGKVIKAKGIKLD